MPRDWRQQAWKEIIHMIRSKRKTKSDKEKIYLSEKLRMKLDRIIDYPVTSIEAPIGYGKTKSCMEYLKKSEQFFIWKSISGRDFNVCWQQFCEALALLNPAVAEKISSVGVPANHAVAERAAELVGKIEREEPVIIVLDTILDRFPESVSYFFEILSRKNIAFLHFVIISRSRFRNHREELRMKHLLLVIDVFDFMLDRDDIMRYFEMCGILIGRGDAERLRRRTDGWIAALYLTVLHWEEDARRDVPNQIYDLFSQTLCRDYTEEQMDFLKKVSPFQTFTMDQARSVRQMRDPEKILEFLLNSCGFIWKLPETSEYHINRLYREYLFRKLESGDEEFRKKVYKNAADWFFHNKSFHKAAYYYYLSGEYDNMLRAFELDQGEHLRADDLRYIQDAFEACPEEIQNQHYLAMMIYARQLFMCGRKEELKRHLERMDEEIRPSSVPEAERHEYNGEKEMLKAYLAVHDPARMTEHLLQSAKQLKHPSAQAGRMSPFTFGAPSVMFLFYTETGRLDELLGKYAASRELYYRLTSHNGRGSEYLFDAEIQFNRGNLDKADILSHKAGTIAAKYHQTGTGIGAWFLQARISIIRGETDRGMGNLDQITALASAVDKRVYSVTGELCESYIYAVFNQINYVADWISRGEYMAPGGVRLYAPAEDFANIVYARVLLDQGEYSKYLGMAEEMTAQAREHYNNLALIYHNVYSAAAYKKMSMPDNAAESLHRAIELAGQDGIIMPFAENGRFLNDFYQQVTLDEKERGFIDRCLQLYNKYEKNMNVLLRGSSDTALSILTRREREISLLVAEGKTNKQIAGELNIAEITVKKCLSNIYSRLGIPNRASLIKIMIS